MVEITFNPEYKNKWTELQLHCIECDVVVQKMNVDLWKQIEKFTDDIRDRIRIEEISKIPSIEVSRKAYKAVGKDPARYRLSAESLLRRVIKGNSLYQINNVVDIVNLASVKSGFSIGGYDVECLQGDVQLGIGKPEEEYFGIGRGELNIEGLTVLRDDIGAFGSPTSDSERTSVTDTTTKFLMVYFDFGALNHINRELEFAEELLVNFAGAKNITHSKFQ